MVSVFLSKSLSSGLLHVLAVILTIKASSWILKCWIQTHPAGRRGPLVISHDTSSSVSLQMIIILKLFVLNMVFCLTQVRTLSFSSFISKAAVVCVVASGS